MGGTGAARPPSLPGGPNAVAHAKAGPLVRNTDFPPTPAQEKSSLRLSVWEDTRTISNDRAAEGTAHLVQAFPVVDGVQAEGKDEEFGIWGT